VEGILEKILDTLSFTQNNGVATVTLKNLTKMNAFNQQMHADWREILDHLEKDDTVRVLITTGEGKAFCSGQDLSETPFSDDGTSAVGEVLDKDYTPFLLRFMGLPFPTINAVNGAAAGAGANFALAADIVVAAHSAFFEESFCKIGLIPDVGGTWMLPRLVGRARALGMMLSAQRVDAQTAQDWGMIWQAVPDEALIETVQGYAQRITYGPRESFKLIKKAVMLSENNSLEQQLDVERDFQVQAGNHPDFKEGLMAFSEKRMPNFKK